MPTLTPPLSDKRFFVFNGVISAAALALLAWLLLLHGGTQGTGLNLRFLPAVNACFNASAAALLVAGWVAVKRGRSDIHRYFMVAAFAASALFLGGYLAYPAVHGGTKVGGGGAVCPE